MHVPIKSNAMNKKKRLSCYCVTNLLASQFELSFIREKVSHSFSMVHEIFTTKFILMSFL